MNKKVIKGVAIVMTLAMVLTFVASIAVYFM